MSASVQAQNVTVGRSWANVVATAYKTNPAATLLTTPTVNLVKAGPGVLTPDTVQAAFTLAAFHGYAAVVITSTLAGPANLPSGNGVGLWAVAAFQATSPLTPPGENIIGYYVDDGANGRIYAMELFQTPVPINVVGDELLLTVWIPFAWQVQVS